MTTKRSPPQWGASFFSATLESLIRLTGHKRLVFLTGKFCLQDAAGNFCTEGNNLFTHIKKGLFLFSFHPLAAAFKESIPFLLCLGQSLVMELLGISVSLCNDIAGFLTGRLQLIGILKL